MNADKDNALTHRALTDPVIGVYHEVYNELGYGFLESVYEEAMCRALKSNGILVERQKAVSVSFRGEAIADFRLDVVVENVLIVEIKAVDSILAIHEVQLVNYLKATGLQVGLLFNFGPRAEFRRRVLDSTRCDPRLSALSASKKV